MNNTNNNSITYDIKLYTLNDEDVYKTTKQLISINKRDNILEVNDDLFHYFNLDSNMQLFIKNAKYLSLMHKLFLFVLLVPILVYLFLKGMVDQFNFGYISIIILLGYYILAIKLYSNLIKKKSKEYINIMSTEDRKTLLNNKDKLIRKFNSIRKSNVSNDIYKVYALSIVKNL